MNGWAFAAIAVVCVTAVFVALLWAAVKASPRERAAGGPSPETEPEPAEAAQRALREGRGEW